MILLIIIIIIIIINIRIIMNDNLFSAVNTRVLSDIFLGMIKW